jgi:hypothetical protein
MLSGGTGQFYGNGYSRSFKDGWRTHIDTPGVEQIGYWKKFFTAIRWQDLVPDQDHSAVTAGFGSFGNVTTRVSISDYATAARTADGSTVVVYIPTLRAVTVNMAALGSRVTAQWFDPSNGAFHRIAGAPFANMGSREFIPPGNNHAGDQDWVLLLKISKSTR